MPRRLHPLPDALGASFSVRDARAQGVSVRRLRHATLERPFHGVRTSLSDQTPADAEPSLALESVALTSEIAGLAAALATIAPPHWFFSHVTAAVLWGLPLPIRTLRRAVREVEYGRETFPPLGIDVAAWTPHRAPKGRGVNGHELRPRLVQANTTAGLRVSTPASTWALLGGILSVDELVTLGDAIVRIPRARGMQRGTADDALDSCTALRAAAEAPYRRHSEKLLLAIDDIRVGSSSPAETRVRLACVRAGLPEPELDVDVFAADGSPIGFTELAYRDHRLLIEYEGDHHRTDREQWQRDVDKHAACADAGWTVLRLTAANVYPDAAPAVARIRAALVRAGWRP